MPLGKYEGPGEIQFDSRTLAEASTVRASVSSNSNQVTTMKKGLAGRSRGAVVSQVTVENAIPKGGLEVEFMDKCVQDADVRITLLIAGRRMTFEGWIDTVDTSQGVNEMATISFTVTAGPPIFL